MAGGNLVRPYRSAHTQLEQEAARAGIFHLPDYFLTQPQLDKAYKQGLRAIPYEITGITDPLQRAAWELGRKEQRAR